MKKLILIGLMGLTLITAFGAETTTTKQTEASKELYKIIDESGIHKAIKDRFAENKAIKLKQKEMADKYKVKPKVTRNVSDAELRESRVSQANVAKEKAVNFMKNFNETDEAVCKTLKPEHVYGKAICAYNQGDTEKALHLLTTIVNKDMVAFCLRSVMRLTEASADNNVLSKTTFESIALFNSYKSREALRAETDNRICLKAYFIATNK